MVHFKSGCDVIRNMGLFTDLVFIRSDSWMKNARIITLLLIMLSFSLNFATGELVQMCENGTYIDNGYQLTRLAFAPSDCACLLKSETPTKVYIKTSIVSGCKYKLGVYIGSTRDSISCDSDSPISHYITTEVIQLKLEPYTETGRQTSFILKITSSPGTKLTLSCSIPEDVSDGSFIDKFLPSESSTTPNISDLKIEDSSSQVQGTERKYIKKDTSSTTGIAIGCFVGGLVLGMLVVLAIQWIMQKRQPKEVYSFPINREDNHVYAVVTPVTRTGSLDTADDVPDTSSNTVDATNTNNATDENNTNSPSTLRENSPNNTYLHVF